MTLIKVQIYLVTLIKKIPGLHGNSDKSLGLLGDFDKSPDLLGDSDKKKSRSSR